LGEEQQLTRFEQAVLPHLDAAYNLARWLTRNEHNAEDVVQEAYLRAWQFFPSFRGLNGRAWLLKIVRHTCYTWLQRHRAHEGTIAFEEEKHGTAAASGNPEATALQKEDRELLHRALEDLPVEFREVIVLRELEGLTYKEIADIAAIPLGSVMSRLARARERLQGLLVGQRPEES
jgi:RNA polymerase sigma factor (sigma-70 family)